VRERIQPILRDAGEILRAAFGRAVAHEAKAPGDLVADVDRKVEGFLISRIVETHPCKSFWSEEAGSVGPATESRWILDPLDGTANFIAGVPHFGISIALERAGRIVEGYVYQPITDELYHASEASDGAFLNGEPIAVSDTDTLSDALVVFGFSANMTNIHRYHDEWGGAFDSCRKGLGLLAPALNLCNVARGRIDAFIDFGSSMEGQAAAALIVQHAGGTVQNYDGSPWDHRTVGVVATNAGLPETLSAL